jgi:hypothetical protein
MLSVVIISEESTSSYISYKCITLTEYHYSVKCALAPPTYKGTSLCKLHDFLLNYNIYFNVIKEYIIY